MYSYYHRCCPHSVYISHRENFWLVFRLGCCHTHLTPLSPRPSRGYPTIHYAHHVPAPLTPRGNPRVSQEHQQRGSSLRVTQGPPTLEIISRVDHAGVGSGLPDPHSGRVRGCQGYSCDHGGVTVVHTQIPGLSPIQHGFPWRLGTAPPMGYPMREAGLPRTYPMVFPWGSVRSPPAVPVAYRCLTPLRHHHGAMTPLRGGCMPNPSSPLARAHMRGVSRNETMKAMKVLIQRTNKTIKPGAGFTRAQRH